MIFFESFFIILLAIFTGCCMMFTFIWFLNIFVDLPIKNKYKKIFILQKKIKKQYFSI